MDRAWRVVDELSDVDRGRVEDLLHAIERGTRDESLTEDHRTLFESRGPARHLLRRDPAGSLAGYAIAELGDAIQAEPALGTFDMDLAATLEALGCPVSLLLRKVDDEMAAGLTARGWHATREVHRMCRSLPADPLRRPL